ncbi:alcohol dehydrogenase catalytic domain-containing protein [Vibrio sp. S12_S33]|uniref:alcohol dehydrogenase catalytic domain-containing protein n=1 Tax=Vibrio sp. S12_S33 TaxID=2720223 RepID=UPI00177B3F17|nr:alcohol dehydrogenase catalytic domain-containing protein [Vibrio sp. S12_S33]MBD1565531.1 alcohol dehydrogenase catalytic domain-containing protein [Vibrio sp. S12_S33]
MNNTVPEMMMAIINHGPNDYRLETVPTPKAGPGELLVKVGACGICASDVKCHSGAHMFWGENPWVKPPVVPGHEFFGSVVDVGDGADKKWNVSIGDRVIAEQIIPCGECMFCKSGNYWMCEPHDMYGFQSQIADGGMAEYMVFKPNSRVHKIPDSLSLADAAIIEPMACSIHTVNRADIGFNDVVVIAGAGPLGLGMVQAAKLRTPKILVVIDSLDDRLELSKTYGADVVINPLKQDAIAMVKELTGGYGCDIYIEATGSPVGVTQGLEMIRKLGRFVEFSVFGKETMADWSIIGDRKELDIRGAHLGPYCYETVINLFERGLITSKGIVTNQYPLTDWENAYEVAASPNSVKVLLIP